MEILQDIRFYKLAISIFVPLLIFFGLYYLIARKKK
jgi:hypothetical protein